MHSMLRQKKYVVYLKYIVYSISSLEANILSKIFDITGSSELGRYSSNVFSVILSHMRTPHV